MAVVKSVPEASGNRNLSGFASLYVGDLSPDVTEEDLVSKFSSIVPAVSAHLCCNSVTEKSMCYAYINFQSPLNASNAMACLNHTDLKGKPMRIMWSLSDLSYRRRSGFGNLFVKNLNSSITSKCLERIFSPFGAILSCKVVEEDGHSKDFGFVQFHTEQSAVAARRALHGSMVEGKILYVAKFINKNERVGMTGNQEFTNVYVKNLIEGVTEDILHRLFSPYGTVSSIAVMRDGLGRSRGFGFVNFCRPENAKKAVESLHGLPVGSKKLFVGRAVRKAERREMLKQEFSDNFIPNFNMEWYNLYVKNLSESIDETRLREIFGSYGKLVSAKVMRYENGKTKGFGFVCFSNLEESKQAIRKLNGFSVDGKLLVVRPAERKEDRLKRLQSYFQRQPSHYTKAPPVPSPVQPVPPAVPSSYGYLQPYFQRQPSHYTQTPPVPSPVQPVAPAVRRSYGYLQPFYVGSSYNYMGTQLPTRLGHQNITTYLQYPAGQAHLKEKRSVQQMYKYPYYAYAGNQNLESTTLFKAASAEELEVATSDLMAMLTPDNSTERNSEAA